MAKEIGRDPEFLTLVEAIAQGLELPEWASILPDHILDDVGAAGEAGSQESESGGDS